jgi:hypothetical protein
MNKGVRRRAILRSGDGCRRFKSAVAAHGGVLGGATGWRRDLEATDDLEVWGTVV